VILDSRDRVFTALNHEEADRVPIDFWISEAALRKLKQHFGVATKDEILDIIDVDLRYIPGPVYRGPRLEAGCDGLRRDIWGVLRKSVAEGAGGGLYEAVVESPLEFIQKAEDIETYTGWPSVDWFDFSTIEAQCEAYRRKKRIVVFSGDRMNRIAQLKPYMYLRGMENTYVDMGLNKDLFMRIVDRIRAFYREYLTRLLESSGGKIDILMTGDDFGSQQSLLCSRETWKELLEPGFTEFISLIKQGGAYAMHHSCGNVGSIIPDMITGGLDILQSIQPEAYAGQVEDLKAKYGRLLSFNGSISIQNTLPFGTSGDIEKEVTRRVEDFGPGGGFIIGTAHNIQADVPVENILSLVSAYKKHLWYK
jgi:uroporphyrinogen decarboxylase